MKKKKLIYSNKICQNIEEVLSALSIEYLIHNDTVKIKCPIHGSDSISNSTISISKQMWSCWSGGCHQEYDREFSVIELVKATLKEKTYEAVFKFVDSVIGGDCKVEILKPIKSSAAKLTVIDKPDLFTPSNYYQSRGFCPKTLNHFGVGDSFNGPFTERAVVPVNFHDQIVGLAGRSHWGRCEKCTAYHNPAYVCPKQELVPVYSKWKFSKGFIKSKILYNHDCMKYNNKIAIVEGMSCVWKLHENGVPSVALLGGILSLDAFQLIQKAGIENILLLLDNDKAGKDFTRKIIREYKNYIGIHLCQFSSKDITAMQKDELENTVLDKWRKIHG